MTKSAAIKDQITATDTFAAHNNITIALSENNMGIAVMPLGDAQRNGMGIAHGGAIFTLADMAFAAASHSTGTFWVNAQSSISFLEPGKIGPLRAEAHCVRIGRTTCTCTVNITDSNGTLVAIATITGHNTHVRIYDN